MNNIQERRRSKLGKQILSIILGCTICGIFLLISIYWREVLHLLTPAPMPLTFFVDIQLESDFCDPYSFYITQSYTVGKPLTEVQDYFENELAQYCTTTWKFQESPYYCYDAPCLIATCNLPPPHFSILQKEPVFVELKRQFSVMLDENSRHQTYVVQSQIIRTYIEGKVDNICGE